MGVPDSRTCSIAINACAEGSAWEAAALLLGQVREHGLRPRASHYTAAMNAFNLASRWAQSLNLVQEMELLGVQADGSSYDKALRACWHGRQWELAVDIVEMSGNRLQLNNLTYNLLIEMLTECGKVTQTALMYRQMVAAEAWSGRPNPPPSNLRS